MAELNPSSMSGGRQAATPPPPPPGSADDFSKPPPAPIPQLSPPQVYYYAGPAPPGAQVIYVQQPPSTVVVDVHHERAPLPPDTGCSNPSDGGSIRSCGMDCDSQTQDVVSWVFCAVGFVFPLSMLCFPGTACICRGRTTCAKVGGGFSLAVMLMWVVYVVMIILLIAVFLSIK